MQRIGLHTGFVTEGTWAVQQTPHYQVANTPIFMLPLLQYILSATRPGPYGRDSAVVDEFIENGMLKKAQRKRSGWVSQCYGPRARWRCHVLCSDTCVSCADGAVVLAGNFYNTEINFESKFASRIYTNKVGKTENRVGPGVFTKYQFYRISVCSWAWPHFYHALAEKHTLAWGALPTRLHKQTLATPLQCHVHPPAL